MKTSDRLRLVQSAAQVIDAELAFCTAAEVFKIQTRVHFRRSGKD